MIYGKPYEFSIFYDLLEETADGYWKHGIFLFFIEDKIYPSKGSNYTLTMAIGYLKDSYQEIIDCLSKGLDLTMNDEMLFATLAHSHGMIIDSDPDDFELPDMEKIGVFLSPLEVVDAGFYLFYYPKDNDEEYLIYSPDYGKTVRKAIFSRGVVSAVLAQLPAINSI
ncbi:Immunity protein 42 [Candidatus Pantoea varia]|uniref:Immunity protein 42 n=2 Tax=Candidatus Pantoea varia TaxID=1881036 RepID=A0A1I4Z757_9GAMM|nr:Immunity protein 42 [Pantoea varia]